MGNGFTKQDSQALKGIAIILMVVYHCFFEPSLFADYVVDYAPFTENLVVEAIWWGKICVSLFAFVSGYGLYLSFVHEDGSPNRWVAKRYVKSFSGYWFIYVLVFVVTMIAVGLPQELFLTDGFLRAGVYAFIDFLGLAQLFGTPTLSGAWWYMTAAALFICLIPLLARLEKRIGWLATLALSIMIPRFLVSYLGGMNALAFVPSMLLGLVFARHGTFDAHDRLCARVNKVLLFVVDTAVFAMSILLFSRLERNVVWEYHFTVAPLICIVYAHRYLLRLPYLSRVLQFFGKHSMNIFLTHMIIQLTLFPAWTYSFKPFWLIPVVLFAESLVLSIVIELVKKLIRYERFTEWLIRRIEATQAPKADVPIASKQ